MSRNEPGGRKEGERRTNEKTIFSAVGTTYAKALRWERA